MDLKAGKLAFKLVYADQGGVETAAPSNCNYAGMEDTPDAGVTLALFDLNKGTAEQFVVYAVALKPADCTPHAQSTQRLAAAKAAFTAAGLDISKKPAPLKPDAKGNFSFAGDHTVHAWAHDVTAESPEDWARIVGGEADISMGHVDAGLRQGEVVLVADSHTFSRNGAGGAGTDFPLAWQQEDKAVFLVRTWSHDMRSGYDEKWTFTPVISL